jgi:hypothetical protein
MVAFYEAYSSVQFVEYQDKLKLNEFVQTKTAQIKNAVIEQSIIRSTADLIVQAVSAQFPEILKLTTLSNHFQILNACKTIEEHIFYVIFSHKEKLCPAVCISHLPLPPPTGDIPLWRGQGEVEFCLLQKQYQFAARHKNHNTSK